MNVTFEWDDEKARLNFTKHKISFEEARSVFDNPQALIIPDAAHSTDEDRHIIIGHSMHERIIMAVFTEREGNIRIISSRKATRTESRTYGQSKKS